MKEAEALVILDDTKASWLKGLIRDVPDFPKPGIVFKDITTVLSEADAFALVVNALAERCAHLKPDKIAGIEARGFIIGAAVASKLGLGFIPIRKPGKLPYESESVSYELEYGTDSLEIHIDAAEGSRVVLIDDVLATGGTASAAARLVEKVGGKLVGIGFAIELSFLNGLKKLPKEVDTFSLIRY
jgi:adenine phosphoribosyltransferase